LVIRFYWDNEETPSVEAPVPEFLRRGSRTIFAGELTAVVDNREMP